MNRSNFLIAMVSHSIRMITFSARFEGLPSSKTFVALTGFISVLAMLAEQLSRNKSLLHIALVVIGGIILALGFAATRDDNRVASGLFIATLPLSAMMALSVWIPGSETVIAIWGGIAMAWLLQRPEATSSQG